MKPLPSWEVLQHVTRTNEAGLHFQEKSKAIKDEQQEKRNEERTGQY